MKSILKYPGSKWRISDWIISMMPEHRVYCEPYFGSGGVFFNKKPAYLETINDLDENIVNLFRVCRDKPNELATAINLTPFARDEFVSCYDTNYGNDVERARRTLVRFHQSFGTTNSSKFSWRNVQTAGGPRCATMWGDLPEIIIESCSRLKDVQIENIDAIELINRYDSPDTLIYCDPPYMQSLRKKNMYAKEMSDVQHIELLSAVKTSNSMVMLSGYDNDLYNSYLEGWYTAEINTIAQMGLHRTEKVWMNFNPSLQYTFFDEEDI